MGWVWVLMMRKHSVTVWKGGLLMGERGCAGRSVLGGALGVCPAAHGHCRGFGAGSPPGTPKNDGYNRGGRPRRAGRECLLAVSSSVPG